MATRFAMCLLISAISFGGLVSAEPFPGDFPPTIPVKSLIDALVNPVVIHELELIEEQVKELRQIKSAFQREVVELVDVARVEKVPGTLLMKQVADIESRVAPKMFDVLLPHQRVRFNQIVIQSYLGKDKRADSWVSDMWLRKQLGVTDEQVNGLQAHARSVHDKLVEELRSLDKQMRDAKLRARNEIVSALTPDQQQRFKEMVGASIDLSPFDPKDIRKVPVQE